MISLWKGKNLIYFGVIKVKGQGHCYYKYNCWQQGRFRTITLVLYIESLTQYDPSRDGRIKSILTKGQQIYYGNIIAETNDDTHFELFSPERLNDVLKLPTST
jgi:hypothetical protein